MWAWMLHRWLRVQGQWSKGTDSKGQIQSAWPDCDNSLLTAFPASVSLQHSSRSHSPAHGHSTAPCSPHWVKCKAFTVWPHCP